MVKAVEPSVHLVAKPAIDWESLADFLEEVGAKEWWLTRYPESLSDESGLNSEGAGATLIEIMGRNCYRSWEPGLNPNVVRVRQEQDEYLQNIVSVGHGSVLEHANYSFVFNNISRVATHELVRHRHEAISQESLRFVRLQDLPVWIPPWAQEDEELMTRALSLLNEMEEFQRWMSVHFGLDDEGVPFSEKKHKTSFMRRFAPIGVATKIGWTANVRSLRHIIESRTSLGAEEEIRLIFDQVAQLMSEELPALFFDAERTSEGEWRFDSHKV